VAFQASRSTSADIDIFRGLAAVAVLALHARESLWIGMRAYWGAHHVSGFLPLLGYVTFPVVWGSIGVPVFFVLSGYCIHRAQALAGVRNPASHLDAGQFYLRRVLRIYPVLFGALLLTAACDYATRAVAPGSDKLGDDSLFSFLVNLFALQGVAGGPYGSNGALWTLSIEIQFYALYPLLLVASKRFGNAAVTAALLFLAIVSYLLLERHSIVVFTSYYFSWWLGALIAEAHAGRKLHLLSAKNLWLIFAASLLSFALADLVFFRSQFLAFQLWSISFAGGLILVLRRKTPFAGPIARLFEWLGGFSYSIYIVHLPLLLLARALLFHGDRQDSILLFYAAIPYAIAGAYLFYWAFEARSVAWSQRVKRSRAKAPAGLIPTVTGD
jgi:peptidoglycan/LPS O-acetylase OafA/YrhL